MNEHLLRYLGWRYPPDYNRGALLWFWLGHLIWLFPWSGLQDDEPQLCWFAPWCSLLYAAHWAMAVFDPYLSSRSLAKEYQDAPPGQLILNHEYYEFSSLVFYTNHSVLLLNGRKNNLEYGSNAPNVPDVFINDNQLSTLWKQYQPVYLATQEADQERFRKLLGSAHVFMVARHGGKLLLSNHSHADPH